MSLPPVEPAAGPWQAVPLPELLRRILDVSGRQAGRPAVVAIDGRSAGGKTTLASRLAEHVLASAVVHTDDMAWRHAFFDWADLLSEGVLEPVRRGAPVRYRPPAWDRHGRAGAIDVPTALEVLLVEGVGAGRRELTGLVDAVVWVQSDLVEAERRGIERDLALGGHGGPEATAAFWREWTEQELAFLERDRPWERACVVVAGTQAVPHGPHEVAVAGPLDRREDAAWKGSDA